MDSYMTKEPRTWNVRRNASQKSGSRNKLHTHTKRKKRLGRRYSTTGQVLALHTNNPDSIPGTPFGSLAPPGVIPKQIARSKL